MKLFEFEAASLLSEAGIPVPPWKLAVSAAEAEQYAREIGLPVAIKAQVLAGGRGKAGGILFASHPGEAGEKASVLLGREIKGLPVNSVLVEKKVLPVCEIYLGVSIDSLLGCPVTVVSSQGGISIE